MIFEAMHPETVKKVIFVAHKSPYVNLCDTDFTLSKGCPDGVNFGMKNVPFYFFVTTFKKA
jgi:hypothetical protein